MEEQMGNESKQMETLGKNQKEMLEINTAPGMKNTFVYPNQLYTAEERINELNYTTLETFQTKMQREKEMKTKKLRTMGQFWRCNVYIIRIPKGEQIK